MDDWNYQCRIDLQKIILSKIQKKILLDHTHKEEPNESCAILYGNKNREEIIVKEIWLIENIDSSPTEFTLSFDQTKEMHEKEKEMNLDIIGIFHSHPKGEAYPSNTDEKYMEVNQDMYVWIIYSGINKNFKAFILESEIPIEEK